MVLDMDRNLEYMRQYLENRPRFPLDELAKYMGSWVAWSPDGTRIVASSNNPDELESLVQAAGEDPMYCVVEGIPEYDSFLGDLHARAS
jgi:hypothetical protein